MIKIPKFETQKELFAWLKENEDDLIYQKKSIFKKADSICAPALLHKTLSASKDAAINNDESAVKVRAIINTTMVRDSHKDVHIDGLWKKSLKENPRIKHLQEHEMAFSKIIADKDDLKAFTKTYSWKDLGYDVEGETQALVFDSNIKASRNPQMYKEYSDGNVDNHSVGMFYVNIKFAMNSTEEGDETYKEEYDKHIDKIANKQEVAKDGYFWAVYEAKVIEGSAVPMGSNPITPTISTSKEDIKPNKEVEVIKAWLVAE